MQPGKYLRFSASIPTRKSGVLTESSGCSADGQYSVGHVSDDAQRALVKADLWLQQEGGLDRLIELKPGALAVHWRGLNPTQVEEVKAAAYRAMSPFASADLLLSEFDGGLELRPRARSKADVVRALLSEHDPEAAVAYLGDDTTDEDAFRALNGRGLTVLVRPQVSLHGCPEDGSGHLKN